MCGKLDNERNSGDIVSTGALPLDGDLRDHKLKSLMTVRESWAITFYADKLSLG